MKKFKIALKWVAGFVVFLIFIEYLDQKSDSIRMGIGLAIFIAALAYQLDKRLSIIEDSLAKLSASTDEY